MIFLSKCIEWPVSTSHVYWSPSCHAEGMLHLMRTISLQASTEADVSFFSTLGCSLRGALTTGSMALALLSPFICIERTLAAAPVCRWLSFYLASPLSLSSPDSWLPQPAAARRQVLGLQEHANPPQTHLCNERLWCIWILTPCTPFFFLLAHSAPSSPVCLSHSYSLSGFFSLFLWSLDSGMSRAFIWRGTSCGPESVWRQLPPVIQCIITSAVAVSGILGTTGSTT